MGDLSEPGDNKVAINALVRKRAEIAGQIRELEHQTDQLRAEMIHVDSMLRLFGSRYRGEKKIPTKPRSPRRSEYFARGELTRICLDALRNAAESSEGWLTGEEITFNTMRDKGLDPVLRSEATRRFSSPILQTLDALEGRYGAVAKSGHKRSGVSWKIAD
jgi:hypothetical protein